nr:hypothetical protein [Tanacetum cinerariifolium]
DTRRPVVAKPQRRSVPVETLTSNALVSQCDATDDEFEDTALATLRQKLLLASKRTIGAARPPLSKTCPHIAPYTVSKYKAPIRRPFIRHTSTKPSISPPRVNAANPSIVSAARVNAARPSAVSAARINDVKPSAVTVVQHNHTKKVWRPKTLVLDHVFRTTSASMTLKRFNYNDALGRSKSVMAWVPKWN